MFKLKNIYISLLCGLVIAITSSVAGFQANCAEIRENTFRLHIIANSDNEMDQNIKLAVRDAVLRLTEDIYANCKSYEEAKHITVQNLSKLETVANNVLQDAGFNYKATAMIGTVTFDTREYENFTLPAGEYEALEIILGEGKGRNWWCVMYPSVCLSVCGEENFNSVLNKQQNDIVNGKEKYKIAFRFIEIFGDIKRFLKKYI